MRHAEWWGQNTAISNDYLGVREKSHFRTRYRLREDPQTNSLHHVLVPVFAHFMFRCKMLKVLVLGARFVHMNWYRSTLRWTISCLSARGMWHLDLFLVENLIKWVSEFWSLMDWRHILPKIHQYNYSQTVPYFIRNKYHMNFLRFQCQKVKKISGPINTQLCSTNTSFSPVFAELYLEGPHFYWISLIQLQFVTRTWADRSSDRPGDCGTALPCSVKDVAQSDRSPGRQSPGLQRSFLNNAETLYRLPEHSRHYLQASNDV